MRSVRFGIIMAVALAFAGHADAQILRKSTGYLGIYSGETIDHGVLRDQAVVTVTDVFKSSPAEKAGIKAGDKILRINGMAASNGKFRALASTLVEGDTVKLRIRRGDQERDYTVIAAERPATMGYVTREIIIAPDSIRRLMLRYLDSARVHLDSIHLPEFRITTSDSLIDLKLLHGRGVFGDSIFVKRDSSMMRIFRSRPGDRNDPQVFETEVGPGAIFRSIELGARAIAGAEFTELDPAMRDYFKTDRGLLTLRVAKDTPAERGGLLPGDIIVKAGGREILKVSDLRTQLASHADGLKLEVLRKGERKTLELKTRSR